MSDDTPTQRFPNQGDDVQEDLQEEKQKSKGLLIGLLVAGALLLVAILVLVVHPRAVRRARPTPARRGARSERLCHAEYDPGCRSVAERGRAEEPEEPDEPAPAPPPRRAHGEGGQLRREPLHGLLRQERPADARSICPSTGPRRTAPMSLSASTPTMQQRPRSSAICRSTATAARTSRADTFPSSTRAAARPTSTRSRSPTTPATRRANRSPSQMSTLQQLIP